MLFLATLTIPCFATTGAFGTLDDKEKGSHGAARGGHVLSLADQCHCMDRMSSLCPPMLLFIGLLDLDRLCGALEGRYSIVDQ